MHLQGLPNPPSLWDFYYGPSMPMSTSDKVSLPGLHLLMRCENGSPSMYMLVDAHGFNPKLPGIAHNGMAVIF